MIFDLQSLFSNAQAITADTLSTNFIDLGAMGIARPFNTTALARDEFAASCVPIMVQCVETFDNLTSMVITLETSDNADMSSPTIVMTSGAVLLAALVAGWRWNIDHLPEGVTKRYLALRYDITGTAPTVGKFTAGIVPGRPSPGR